MCVREHGRDTGACRYHGAQPRFLVACLGFRALDRADDARARELLQDVLTELLLRRAGEQPSYATAAAAVLVLRRADIVDGAAEGEALYRKAEAVLDASIVACDVAGVLKKHGGGELRYNCCPREYAYLDPALARAARAHWRMHICIWVCVCVSARALRVCVCSALVARV